MPTEEERKVVQDLREFLCDALVARAKEVRASGLPLSEEAMAVSVIWLATDAIVSMDGCIDQNVEWGMGEFFRSLRESCVKRGFTVEYKTMTQPDPKAYDA